MMKIDWHCSFKISKHAFVILKQSSKELKYGTKIKKYSMYMQYMWIWIPTLLSQKQSLAVWFRNHGYWSLFRYNVLSFHTPNFNSFKINVFCSIYELKEMPDKVHSKSRMNFQFPCVRWRAQNM